MFPEIDIDMEIDIDDETQESVEKPTLGRVPLYDFEKNRYVIKDGKIAEASEDEAIQQWVAFLISTKKDKFAVYEGTNFGTYIENYIGLRGSNIDFVASEFEREIREGCAEHPLIEDIQDFAMDVVDGCAVVSLFIVKKNGEELEVELNV